MAKCDPRHGKFMACCLMYKGGIVTKAFCMISNSTSVAESIEGEDGDEGDEYWSSTVSFLSLPLTLKLQDRRRKILPLQIQLNQKKNKEKYRLRRGWQMLSWQEEPCIIVFFYSGNVFYVFNKIKSPHGSYLDSQRAIFWV